MAQVEKKIITADKVKVAVKKTATPKKVSPAKKAEVVSKPAVVETVAVEHKTAKFINKNIKISPRKLRLIVDQVRSLNPQVAMNRLKFTNNLASRILIKAIQNVVSDAKNNFNLNPDNLKFTALRVDEGMKIKRMDKSHGSRFARGIIQKRHSRLVIEVTGQANQ
jgi:large subunit ribosomal protein L22